MDLYKIMHGIFEAHSKAKIYYWNLVGARGAMITVSKRDGEYDYRVIKTICYDGGEEGIEKLKAVAKEYIDECDNVDVSPAARKRVQEGGCSLVYRFN